MTETQPNHTWWQDLVWSVSTWLDGVGHLLLPTWAQKRGPYRWLCNWVDRQWLGEQRWKKIEGSKEGRHG